MKIKDLTQGQIALINYDDDKVIIMRNHVSHPDYSQFYILGSVNGRFAPGDSFLPNFTTNFGDDNIIKLLNLNLDNLSKI